MFIPRISSLPRRRIDERDPKLAEVFQLIFDSVMDGIEVLVHLPGNANTYAKLSLSDCKRTSSGIGLIAQLFRDTKNLVARLFADASSIVQCPVNRSQRDLCKFCNSRDAHFFIVRSALLFSLRDGKAFFRRDSSPSMGQVARVGEMNRPWGTAPQRLPSLSFRGIRIAPHLKDDCVNRNLGRRLR